MLFWAESRPADGSDDASKCNRLFYRWLISIDLYLLLRKRWRRDWAGLELSREEKACKFYVWALKRMLKMELPGNRKRQTIKRRFKYVVRKNGVETELVKKKDMLVISGTE